MHRQQTNNSYSTEVFWFEWHKNCYGIKINAFRERFRVRVRVRMW